MHGVADHLKSAIVPLLYSVITGITASSSPHLPWNITKTAARTNPQLQNNSDYMLAHLYLMALLMAVQWCCKSASLLGEKKKLRIKI